MTSRQTRVGESTRYELSGDDLSVSYATDFSGQSMLTIRYEGRVRTFTGDAMATLDTEIGRLVTVAFDDGAADTSGSARSARDTLTVLVPLVFLDEHEEAPISTDAVRAIAGCTVERRLGRGWTLRPQTPGWSGVYQVMKLHGTARSTGT